MSNVTLPDEGAVAAWEERAWSSLRSLVVASADPVLWAVAPKLAISMTGIDRLRARGTTATVRAIAHDALGQGPTITLAGGTAIVTTSAGQRRILAPIVSELGRSHGSAPRRLPRTGPAPLRALGAAHRRGRLVADWARAAGVALEQDPIALVHGAELALRRAERWLQVERPERIVVATQHNTVVRCILLAARAAGVPTLYLPHAPAADTPWYRDLPVDQALLRGEGERTFYQGLGVPPEQLTVVGDPSIEEPERGADVRPDAPVVWATSPHPPPVLRSIVELLAATGQPVEVAPHPRADLTDLRAACPPGWRWSSARTTAVRLVAEPLRALVQHRSGMGLEARLRGVPVVELCAPGRTVPYLYLGELATIVRSSAEVTAALAGAASPVGDVGRWCAFHGSSAVDRCLVALDVGRPAPLALDGWGAR